MDDLPCNLVFVFAIKSIMPVRILLSNFSTFVADNFAFAPEKPSFFINNFPYENRFGVLLFKPPQVDFLRGFNLDMFIDVLDGTD